MMRRGLVIAALFALAACEGDAEADARGCFSIQDCVDGETCFYGRCVEAGFGFTTVYAELTPPNDSPWLEQQVPYPLSLDGFQEISVRASAPLSGMVRPVGVEGDSLTGVMLVRSVSDGIPGRDIVRQANVSLGGFELELLPGLKALTFEPADDAKPPKDYWVDMGEIVRDHDFRYPTAAELAANTYRGRVLQTDSLGTESAGARVFGFGSSPQHPDTEFRSTVGTTNEDGDFEITFLPQATEFSVRVGPNPGINDGVPEVIFGPFDSASGTDLGNLNLGIEFGQPVTAAIVDESGTPVHDADVLFEGSVGEFDGRFVASGSSDAFGNVVDAANHPVNLWFGDYTVTVAPQKSQPYALVSKVATIPNGDIQVTVRWKVRLAGCVKEDDGKTPVADADLTITRLDSPIPRVFRTTTAANGCYDVQVDPGTVNAADELTPASYELTVQPGADTGLPFYRELMQVWKDQILTHDIQLYEPELVYGMVRDPNGMPLANVIIAFYSTELGLPDEPVLVGVVSTLDGIRAGEFVLPVPVPREAE